MAVSLSPRLLPARHAPRAPHASNARRAVGARACAHAQHTCRVSLQAAPRTRVVAAAGAASVPPLSEPLSAEEKAHLATVAAKVASCASRLKRASWVGFWTQLILSVVSAVIIIFSIVFKGVTKARGAACWPPCLVPGHLWCQPLRGGLPFA
jgi:hypothetical protein